MSGPKVVRIVTREELIVRCQRELRRLDVAVATWVRTCRSENLASDEEIAAVEERRAAIRTLFEQDAFVALQKQARDEAGFLISDLARRREAAAEAAAAERTRKRRLASAAATLTNAIARSGAVTPESLKQKLEAIAGGAVDDDAEDVLAQGFACIAPLAAGGIDAQQREIAMKLGAGEATETLAGWLAGRPALDDSRARDLDRRLAALEATEGAGAIAAFSDRAARIASEPSPARRALLADSLLLELTAETQRAERRLEQALELETLASILADESPESPLPGDARAALERRDAEEIGALIDKLGDAVKRMHSERASEARRKSVLGALATLGYEVREGMATAWASDGGVVLRNPGRAGLGVKLTGGAGGGPLQMRPVRFGAAQSAESDRDAEVLWCGDFDALKRVLADDGGGLSLEHAAPIGKFRLELIEESDRPRPDARASGDRSASMLRERKSE